MRPLAWLFATCCLLLAMYTPAATAVGRNLLASGGGNNCTGAFGSKPVTVLFFADPGDYSGSAETKFVLANTRDLKQITNYKAHCGNAFAGTLMGKRIAIITTGIGPLQAMGCIQAVLQACGSRISEAIYMGTAGWSPAFGGILEPPACDTVGTHRGKGEVSRLGDLCISPLAINWDCKLADWVDQAANYPNLCTAPAEEFGPDASFLYGECIFTDVNPGSVALSMELANAARHAPMSAWPNRTAAWMHDTQYWGHMNNGTTSLNVSYYLYSEDDTAPNVFDMTQCAEVDSQFFFSGPPYEWVNRKYVALTLNRAYNVSTYNYTNVLAANAMEAIGFIKAMQDYNRDASRKIPYTNMRGNSDYSHEPLQYLGNGNWTYNHYPGDNTLGYLTAIASYSTALLEMMKDRCLRTSSNPLLCTYTVDVTA